MGAHKLSAEARAKNTKAVHDNPFVGLRYRPFLVINTIQRPINSTVTASKGWTEEAKNWALFERPFVVDRITAKVMKEATVIIDVTRGTALKSRFESEASGDEVVSHYLDKYRDEVKEAINIWLDRMARKMAAEPHFARPAATPATEAPEAAGEAAEATETAAAE